jgi:hypothetical protein
MQSPTPDLLELRVYGLNIGSEFRCLQSSSSSQSLRRRLESSSAKEVSRAGRRLPPQLAHTSPRPRDPSPPACQGCLPVGAGLGRHRGRGHEPSGAARSPRNQRHVSYAGLVSSNSAAPSHASAGRRVSRPRRRRGTSSRSLPACRARPRRRASREASRALTCLPSVLATRRRRFPVTSMS